MRLLFPLCLLALFACDGPRRAGGHSPSSTEVDASRNDRGALSDSGADNDGAAPGDAGTEDAREPLDGGALGGDAFFFDANALADAEEHVDAGFTPPDAGFTPSDAGFTPSDAGFTPSDAGFTPSDAGFTPPDAGFTLPDAGFTPPDAGFTPPDAGTPRDAGFVGDAGTSACAIDSDCPSGRCHPLYRQCVPAGQRLDCATCGASSECGLPTDHCLHVTFGGSAASEDVCLQGCRGNSDCTRGYECSLNGHCYPIPGSLRPHTCASMRDTLAATPCSTSADLCGLPTLDDGTCMLGLNCTIGCDSDAHCPIGTSCTDYIVAKYCVR